MEVLSDRERIDDIGFSGYRLIQNTEWFKYGVDAVIISDFAKLKKNARVADLGTGTGVIPLILMHKYSPEKVFGVEVQKEVAKTAERTVRLNGLEEKIEIINANVKEASEIIGKYSLDAVVTNPPYFVSGGGIKGDDMTKAIARHEIEGTLEDFVKCAFELLKEGGDFYMIHRPSRLVDVVYICRKYRLEPKDIQFVQPAEGKKPNIFMIHCVKYGGSELKFMDPLCVYDENRNYTKQILDIYER